MLSESMPEAILVQLVAIADKQAKRGFWGGFTLCVVGFIFALVGGTGTIDWKFDFLRGSSSLSNASPGIVLLVTGLIIIIVTRFSVRK